MAGESVLVGVGVIIVRDDLVLLGQRVGSHGAGTWALPAPLFQPLVTLNASGFVPAGAA